MNIEFHEIDGSIALEFTWPNQLGSLFSPPFSEHDFKDLEFVLATRTAMALTKVCTETSGEHTCAYASGHGLISHHCRACLYTW